MRPDSGRNKWNSRLLAGVLGVTLLILAAVAVGMFVAYQQAAADLVVERDRQVVYLSATRLKDELLAAAEPLTALARTAEIYGGNVATQSAALQRAAFRLAAFDGGVVLLDNYGHVRASQPDRPEILGQDWSDRQFFRDLLASSKTTFSDGLADGSDGALTMVLSVPVLDENGAFVGALAGEFGLGEPSASSFYASIVRLRIGQSGTTYVVDGNRRILYDSSQQKVGAEFDAGALPAGGLHGLGGAVRTRDEAGHDVVAAYAPVPGTNWTLVTEDDWATVTQTTRPYAGILFSLLAVGMVLPVAGALLMLRQLRIERHDQERLDEALGVANLVQRHLLPKQVPMLPGWEVAVHYQPARGVGGDFYDFSFLEDGRLMLALGDVEDRSVSGALVTATIRAALRGAARRGLSPAETLSHGNELLAPELVAGQGVSSLYSVLDPVTGRWEFAKAGTPVVYRLGRGGVRELVEGGQALGLSLASHYLPAETALRPGECLFLASDGLIEARNAQGERFGKVRLEAVLRQAGCGADLVEAVQAELRRFVGSSWTQEDDITLLTLERRADGRPA